jgi:hypothetical protein
MAVGNFFEPEVFFSETKTTLNKAEILKMSKLATIFNRPFVLDFSLFLELVVEISTLRT